MSGLHEVGGVYRSSDRITAHNDQHRGSGCIRHLALDPVRETREVELTITGSPVGKDNPLVLTAIAGDPWSTLLSVVSDAGGVGVADPSPASAYSYLFRAARQFGWAPGLEATKGVTKGVNGYGYSKDLNPDKALIFRITHRDNVPWILEHGLVCANGQPQDPSFVPIGNPDLIDKRTHRPVPVAPGGTLADYVPFYFTPFSPMLMNIKTGHGGVQQRLNDEIVILVSSLHRISHLGLAFAIADRHAYLRTAKFFNALEDLDQIDWDLLQHRDFRRDLENPDKFDRYQAEALVHGHVPREAFLGVVAHTETVVRSVQAVCDEQELDVKVIRKTGWYF